MIVSKCSECPAPLVQHARGRKRKACSDACARARLYRLKNAKRRGIAVYEPIIATDPRTTDMELIQAVNRFVDRFFASCGDDREWVDKHSWIGEVFGHLVAPGVLK